MTFDSESRNESFVTAKQGTDGTNPSEHSPPVPVLTISAQEVEEGDEEAYPDDSDEEESFVIRN